MARSGIPALLLTGMLLAFAGGAPISGQDVGEGGEVQVQKDGEFEIPRVDGEALLAINREPDFKNLTEEIVPRVEELSRAKSKEHFDELTDKLADDYGVKGICVLVRFRTPLVIPLLTKLVDHDKWYVRRLAIFGLQRNGGATAMPKIVERLSDDNFLVREIAATTLAVLHNYKYHKDLWPRDKAERRALSALRKRREADLAALGEAMEKEPNPYVRCAMEASIRAVKKFKLLRVSGEYTTTLAGGPHVPLIPRGGSQSAPGGSRGGGRSPKRPSKEWCYPVAVYPKEVYGSVSSDPPLKPLPAKGNSLHFGHDCAWFLEGAGVYAIGDGALRMVSQRGDFGVVIVGEYAYEQEDDRGRKTKAYVCGLNGHCGMWAFAAPGPVKCRQLLGTIGLSFSVENGIHHAAHDHFGMFKGTFDPGKCYGRGGAGTLNKVKDWLIPADFLGPKVVGREIDPESY